MADSAQPPLKFTLGGLPKDDGLVRVQEFLTFLDNTIQLLRRLERKRAGRAGLSYRIVDLEIGSATVALDAPPLSDAADPETIFDDFTAGFAGVLDGSIDRLGFDVETVDRFRSLVAPIRSDKLRSIELEHGDIDVVLTAQTISEPIFSSEIESHAVGSVAGFVDALNVHRNQVFFLYPPVQPGRVTCSFDQPLLDTVRQSIKRYVTVTGLLEYTEGSAFPHRVTVESVEVHPPEDELPSLDSLFGIVPDLTGGVESVEYLRRLRAAAD